MDLASVGGAAPKLGAGGAAGVGNDGAGGGGEAPSALRSESIFLRKGKKQVIFGSLGEFS